MKINTIAASLLAVLPFTCTVTVAADDIISKEEAISYIWEDEWNGHEDDGTTWPEASYNYHLLESWVNDNYGNPDYNWSDAGQLEYSYSHYYRDLTENWIYFDDEEGGWFITDEESGAEYHFEYRDNTWYMIDGTGEIKDSFEPHSTQNEDNEAESVPAVPDDDGNVGKVVYENEDAVHQKASEWNDSKTGNIQPAAEMPAVTEQEENTVNSSSKKIIYALSALAGAGVLAGIIYTVKKKG